MHEAIQPEMFKVIAPEAWFYLACFSIIALISIGLWFIAQLREILKTYGTRLSTLEMDSLVQKTIVSTHEEKLDVLNAWRESQLAKPRR